MKTRISIVLIALALLTVALTGCLSRGDAASWANDFCADHGGVNTKSQNGFYYSNHGEGEANVTCADGTVGADD